MYLQLMIINKSGGLVYNQDLSPQAAQLDSNDWLRIGSTFHSLHEIARSIPPGRSSGIVALETSSFALRCLEDDDRALNSSSRPSAAPKCWSRSCAWSTNCIRTTSSEPVSRPGNAHHPVRLFTEHVTELFEESFLTGTNANARHRFFTRLR